MLQKRIASSKGRVASLVILLVAATLGLVGLWQRQAVADNILALQYQPSSAIVQIRDNIDLTEYGTLLFNASQPKLQVAGEFNNSCQQHKETNNPILGCYIGQRVYIYDVKHEKLQGIEETTAAHEILHAAYERMGESEKAEINAEIKEVLSTITTPDLEKRLEYYRKTEPGEEYNELHAILGTEFPELGSALEQHYSKYFRSRKTIVNYYSGYNSVFESVTTRLEAQLDTINDLTSQTNAQIAQYNQKQKTLNDDIDAFNARAQSGGYSSTADYQADRNELEARRISLQVERSNIEANIRRIKDLTSERNKLVKEYNALSQSINSSLEPITSLES
jgi:hypothetical protein